MMLFQYPKTKKIVEVLNDLIRIENDRLSGYQSALESTYVEPHLNTVISNCIQEGIQYKTRLVDKIRQIAGNKLQDTAIPGKLYGVWTDLKVKFSNSNRKSVISSCQYNEVIALHVSNAAVNSMELGPEICSLIQEQEKMLKRNMDVMKSCSEKRPFIYAGPMYFN
jgi:uncharacterized protein (TIGR02284 family)